MKANLESKLRRYTAQNQAKEAASKAQSPKPVIPSSSTVKIDKDRWTAMVKMMAGAAIEAARSVVPAQEMVFQKSDASLFGGAMSPASGAAIGVSAGKVSSGKLQEVAGAHPTAVEAWAALAKNTQGIFIRDQSGSMGGSNGEVAVGLGATLIEGFRRGGGSLAVVGSGDGGGACFYKGMGDPMSEATCEAAFSLSAQTWGPGERMDKVVTAAVREFSEAGPANKLVVIVTDAGCEYGNRAFFDQLRSEGMAVAVMSTDSYGSGPAGDEVPFIEEYRSVADACSRAPQLAARAIADAAVKKQS